MESVNCMEGKSLLIDKLLDGKGFVKVVKVSPETHPPGYTSEYLIAKAARLSYNSSNKSAKADKSLIEHLIRHRHTSPLEMCSITFCINLPIAICRQLLRHRTGKFNEFSQRYSEVEEENDRFRLTESDQSFRGPCKLSKQASEKNFTPPQIVKVAKLMNSAESKLDEVFKIYKELVDVGLAKELARFYLPVSTYTKIFVQFDLNNLIKFFQLRCAEDAQYEIRVYADAMLKLARQFFPISLDVFQNYRDGMWLGELEKQVIRERKIPDSVTSKTLRSQLEKMMKDLNLEIL